MNTSLCAYCGVLAENPTLLGFAIDDDDDEEGPLAIRLPLCTACSQLWCPQPAAPEPQRLPSETR